MRCGLKHPLGRSSPASRGRGRPSARREAGARATAPVRAAGAPSLARIVHAGTPRDRRHAATWSSPSSWSTISISPAPSRIVTRFTSAATSRDWFCSVMLSQRSPKSARTGRPSLRQPWPSEARSPFAPIVRVGPRPPSSPNQELRGAPPLSCAAPQSRSVGINRMRPSISLARAAIRAGASARIART